MLKSATVLPLFCCVVITSSGTVEAFFYWPLDTCKNFGALKKTKKTKLQPDVPELLSFSKTHWQNVTPASLKGYLK